MSALGKAEKPGSIEDADSSQSDSVIRKAKWAAMKEEFLELAITGKDIHWPTLAGKYGFNSQTARNKASTNKWYAEIEIRRREREDILDKKLTERTTMALDKLNEDFMTSEVAIRKRHATIARSLQARAVSRLKELSMADFKPRDVLFMLRLGLEEERFAMGFPEVYEGRAPDDALGTEFKSVAEKLGGHRKVQALGTLILGELQKMDIGSVQDVQAKPVQLMSPDIGIPISQPDAGITASTGAPNYQPVPAAKPKFVVSKGAKP